MTFSEDSPQGEPQNSACDLANYVLVDRASLAEVRTTLWQLAEQLATFERAAYNIEACENYWEAQLSDGQILERVEYFHGKFWDELPKGGLGKLHAQTVDLGRVLTILSNFALSIERDK
jgi:hypothetical protein